MDNIIDLTQNITYTPDNDISSETYDLIQKIKHSTPKITGTMHITEFKSSGTWVYPASKPSLVYLYMIGGGGGGAGSRTSGSGAAGGGGGGIIERLLTDVTSDITITIGAKGDKGGANAVGSNGGNSTAVYGSTTLTATGGQGGQGEGSGSGGDGGTGDYSGGNGADGELNNGQAGSAGKYGLCNGGGAGSDFNGNLKSGGAGNAGSLLYMNAIANTGNGGGGAGYTSTAGDGGSGYAKIIYWD